MKLMRMVLCMFTKSFCESILNYFFRPKQHQSKVVELIFAIMNALVEIPGKQTFESLNM